MMKNLVMRKHVIGSNEERKRGYFNNIVKELKIEDRFGFREMFRMDIADLSSFLLRFSIEFHQKKDWEKLIP